MARQYRTFDLSIPDIQDSEGRYSVQAKYGQRRASGLFEGDLSSLMPLVEIRARPTIAKDLKKHGRALYKSFFSEPIAALYNAALGEVENHTNMGLRLRLEIVPAEIAVLPWELLYDPHREKFLAAWPKTHLTRFVGTLNRERDLECPDPIRMLVVIPQTSRLETEEELDIIQNFQNRLTGRVEVHNVAAAVTIQSIRDALRQDDFHLLHFAGHGYLRDEAGFIGLDDADSVIPKLLSASSFAQLLDETPTIRLVILNACYGATLSNTEDFAGVAPQLLKRSVQAVVAMQSPIEDKKAIRFADALYTTLTSKRWSGQIEEAVTRARSSLLVEREHSPDFASPVLYLRAPKGRLWPPPERSTEVTPPTPAGDEMRSIDSMRKHRASREKNSTEATGKYRYPHPEQPAPGPDGRMTDSGESTDLESSAEQDPLQRKLE